jgi:sialate O-acetylesterase
MTLRDRLVLACCVSLCAAPAFAQDAPALLAPMFGSHAVLQRDRPIAVWGTAHPTDRVTVTLNGGRVQATASADGRWRATLPPMEAGGPFVLAAASSSGQSQSVDDVMVGDVWLCSGQSNMELPVARTLNAEDEIAHAASDSIRLLSIAHADSPAPLDAFRTPVAWGAAAPDTVRAFSGACYYFARELQKTVAVPMGLIHSSWGGSNIEAWISANGFDAIGGSREQIELLRLYARDRPAAVARLGEMWETWWRAQVPTPPGADPWSAASDEGWSAAPAALGNWKTWGVAQLASFDGMVWYRTHVTLTPAQAAQPATLSLGGIDEVDETWVNGRPVGNTFGWGTPRRYELPAGTLQAGDNLVVVNVLSTWDKGGLLGPADAIGLRLADATTIPLGSGWRYKPVPASMGLPPRAPWHAIGGFTTLYNAMIAPIGPYTLRGALWYQGESNTSDPGSYERLLAGLMADWRGTFGPDLAFLIVQLPNFGPAPTAPVESGWAGIRDAQRRAVAADAHAGLAVAIDAGDRNELHPPDKQEIGRRLARAARHVVYGEAISPSGPVARSALRDANAIVVAFGDVEGRLVAYSGKGPNAFEVCGADQASCRFADAAIDGNRVLIRLDDSVGAAAATRVRYCWGAGPVCTLYDESGLPAGPFELPIAAAR